MAGIAVGCEYGDFVSQLLQANGGIYDESFGPANAQIWMEENNVSLRLLRRRNRFCLPWRWHDLDRFATGLVATQSPIAVLTRPGCLEAAVWLSA